MFKKLLFTACILITSYSFSNVDIIGYQECFSRAKKIMPYGDYVECYYVRLSDRTELTSTKDIHGNIKNTLHIASCGYIFDYDIPGHDIFFALKTHLHQPNQWLLPNIAIGLTLHRRREEL